MRHAGTLPAHILVFFSRSARPLYSSISHTASFLVNGASAWLCALLVATCEQPESPAVPGLPPCASAPKNAGFSPLKVTTYAFKTSETAVGGGVFLGLPYTKVCIGVCALSGAYPYATSAIFRALCYTSRARGGPARAITRPAHAITCTLPRCNPWVSALLRPLPFQKGVAAALLRTAAGLNTSTLQRPLANVGSCRRKRLPNPIEDGSRRWLPLPVWLLHRWVPRQFPPTRAERRVAPGCAVRAMRTVRAVLGIGP